MVDRRQDETASSRLPSDDRPLDSTWEAQGPAISATARLLEPDEVPAVSQALAQKYPILQGKLVPLAHRLRHYDTVHYELRASEATGP
jgi:hypothetical protein